jgi:Ni/Co efflux regulator RcnB
MRLLTSTLIAGVLAATAAAPAFADPPHRYDRYDRYERYDRGWGDGRWEDRRWRDDDDHWDDRRWRHDRGDWRDDRRAYERGYRDGVRHERRNDWRQGYYYHAPRWRIGDYYPRHSRYVVVHDYHRYHLPPPRRGHHYIESDGEILLVAAATGLIVWALTN